MASQKMGMNDIELGGRRVFLRADLNVPLDEHGEVADATRLRAVAPTVQALRRAGARIILASHLGRPKGKRVASLSLAPVARYLAEALDCPVPLAGDCVGPEVESAVSQLRDGELLLLENLRFHPQEETNDPAFAAQLAALADVYVNDAFGAAHRAHASTHGIAQRLRPAVAGLLMQRELDYLSGALVDPTPPVVVLLGGAKVSGKLAIVKHLLDSADRLLIGGAMAFTFLLAKGLKVGASLVDPGMVDEAQTVLKEAEQRGVSVLLPSDVAVAAERSFGGELRIVPVDQIPAEMIGLDIGPATCKVFAQALADAGTIIWNGPMGVFETPPFDAGTMNVANAVAASAAMSVAGGGDTDRAVHQAGIAEHISFISTGGGAFLEFLQGRELPGIAILDDRPH